jgi:hypothetical protein
MHYENQDLFQTLKSKSKDSNFKSSLKYHKADVP